MKKMKSFILLIVVLLFSCTNHQENNKVLHESKEDVQKIDSGKEIYKDGNFYCVVGDTILVLNLVSVEFASKTTYQVDRSVYFGSHFFFDEDELENYSHLIDATNDKLIVTDDNSSNRTPLILNDWEFSILDESNEFQTLHLFSLRPFYWRIKPRDDYQTESDWKSDVYAREIQEFQKNRGLPIEHYYTSISYLDLNNNRCRMASGYVGKTKNVPNFDYDFSIVQKVMISKKDTIISLGSHKEVFNDYKEIVLFDLRGYNSFDYICIGFSGLDTLASDLGKKIIPTDYSKILKFE